MRERSTRTPRIERAKRSRIKRLASIADGLTHDARASLAVIQEYAALMREGLFGTLTDEQQRVLDVIADRAGDLSRVIDNAVDANRLALRSHRLWRRACQLQGLVSRIRPALERKAAVRNIHFRSLTNEVAPDIYCDEEVAGRALVDIIGAALNLCNDGCRIAISQETDAERNEAGVRLSVEGGGSDLVGQLFQSLSAEGDGANRADWFREPHLSAELIVRNLGRIAREPAGAEGAALWIGFALADPVEVLRRHLVRVTICRRNRTYVSLFQAQLETPDSEQISRDASVLLNSCIGRDDLIFQLDHSRWLVALIQKRFDADRFGRLLEQRRVTVNQKRLGRLLPEILLQTIGSLEFPAEVARLVALVERLTTTACTTCLTTTACTT